MPFVKKNKNGHALWSTTVSQLDQDCITDLSNQLKNEESGLHVIDVSTIKTYNPGLPEKFLSVIEQNKKLKVAVISSSEFLKAAQTRNLSNCIVLNPNLINASEKKDSSAILIDQMLFEVMGQIFLKHLNMTVTRSFDTLALKEDDLSAAIYLKLDRQMSGVVFQFPVQTIAKLTEAITNEKTTDRSLMADCVCEVLNWTLGRAKATFSEQGLEYEYTGPSNLSNHEVADLSQQPNVVQINSLIETPAGPFQYILFIRKSE